MKVALSKFKDQQCDCLTRQLQVDVAPEFVTLILWFPFYFRQPTCLLKFRVLHRKVPFGEPSLPGCKRIAVLAIDSILTHFQVARSNRQILQREFYTASGQHVVVVIMPGKNRKCPFVDTGHAETSARARTPSFKIVSSGISPLLCTAIRLPVSWLNILKTFSTGSRSRSLPERKPAKYIALQTRRPRLGHLPD